MKTLLVVRARWRHLGGHSGLAPLIGELGQYFRVKVVSPNLLDHAIGVLLWSVILLSIRRKWKHLIPWSPFYSRESVVLELAAFRSCIFWGRPHHVLYEAVEDHYFLLHKLLPRRLVGELSISGIFHQPPSWWKLNGVGKAAASGLRCAFVLSLEAEKFLSDLLPVSVRRVDHGVDWVFFRHQTDRSLDPSSESMQVVFSGQWLRDFSLLHSIIRLAFSERLPVEFVLIVPLSARRPDRDLSSSRLSNVTWKHGLSDSELAATYGAAHMMLLPLQDATANNSLLEGMAAGLPILVTDLSGVREYGQDTVIYISDDPSQIVSIIRDAHACYSSFARLGAKAAA
ncbi:MAG: glycosyltransferase family 1 protein, partial [Alphaproteobacteria bacterium]